MGLLDNNMGLDPTTLGLLGAAQALAPYAQATRLPTSGLGAIGAAAGGFGEGYQGAVNNQAKLGLLGAQRGLYAQEAQKNDLANQMMQLRIKNMQDPNAYDLGIGGQSQGGYQTPIDYDKAYGIARMMIASGDPAGEKLLSTLLSNDPRNKRENTAASQLLERPALGGPLDNVAGANPATANTEFSKEYGKTQGGIPATATNAQNTNLAAWLKPLEERQASRTLFPAGLPGAPNPNAMQGPQFNPLIGVPMNLGGGTAAGAPSGPQPRRAAAPAQPAPAPAIGTSPGVLSYNSPEVGDTSKDLAKETAEWRDAAVGAYTQRANFQKMLGQVNGATLGTLAPERGEFKNFLNTYLPSLANEKEVTQNQVFDKLATQVAGGATNQLDQKAFAALQTMRSAYPNRTMTDSALREMIGQLSGFQDWLIQRDDARFKWINGDPNSGTPGHNTASGFVESDWMKNNPPEQFMKAGIEAAGGGSGQAPALTPQNQAAAAALRNNYRLLSKEDQAKQRPAFLKQLEALGVQ